MYWTLLTSLHQVDYPENDPAERKLEDVEPPDAEIRIPLENELEPFQAVVTQDVQVRGLVLYAQETEKRFHVQPEDIGHERLQGKIVHLVQGEAMYDRDERQMTCPQDGPQVQNGTPGFHHQTVQVWQAEHVERTLEVEYVHKVVLADPHHNAEAF